MCQPSLRQIISAIVNDKETRRGLPNPNPNLNAEPKPKPRPEPNPNLNPSAKTLP